jgi:hypothetical protein
LAYLLQQETALLEIAQLLGADTLPPQQQVALRTAAQLAGRGDGAGRGVAGGSRSVGARHQAAR